METFFIMTNNSLRTARIKANLTQKQVADLMGISQAAYQKWESGNKNPRTQNLQKLSEILNVSPDYIQGRDDELEDIIEVLKEKTLDEDDKQEIIALLRKYLDK